MKTLFASKAEVGTKYLTKRGFPVKVVEVAAKFTKVESLVNGHKILSIDPGALLTPFSEAGISKEAREAMRGNVAEKKLAAKPKVENKLIGKTLKREYKGTEYEVAIKADGYHFKGKIYKSLSKVATEIAGQLTSGPAWWGLR